MNMVHIWCMLVYMHCYFMGMNMIVFTFNFVIMCVSMVIITVIVPMFVSYFFVTMGMLVVFNHCKICTNYHYYSGNK